MQITGARLRCWPTLLEQGCRLNSSTTGESLQHQRTMCQLLVQSCMTSLELPTTTASLHYQRSSYQLTGARLLHHSARFQQLKQGCFLFHQPAKYRLIEQGLITSLLGKNNGANSSHQPDRYQLLEKGCITRIPDTS